MNATGAYNLVDQEFSERGHALVQGFAAQAASLLEAARENERAVRDLDETAQILAQGVEELAACEGLAQAMSGLGEKAALLRTAAADIERGVADASVFVDACEAAAQAVEQVEAATVLIESLSRRAAELAAAVVTLEERVGAACEAIDAADPAGISARLDRLDHKLDLVVELLNLRREEGTSSV